MQHIKSYFNKIENILAKRSGKPVKKDKLAGGFAAPSSKTETTKKKEAIDVVADYIEGIREARDQMMKAKK